MELKHPKLRLKTSTPTSSSSCKTKFPNCSSILWDKRCIGTEIETSFSYFRDISLSVVERALRLAYTDATSHFKAMNDPLHRGFFIGSLSSHDLDDEIKIIVNRFDSGIYVSHNRKEQSWPTLTSKLQDDIIIPVLLVNRREVNDASELADELFGEFVKEIEENSSNSLDSLAILKLFRCLCVCQYTDHFGELSFDLSWNLIAPATTFLLKPLNPVPIIPTALARNLSGPLSLSSLQNAPKHGFLTMDQTRKLLLLLESDPKISTLPLVGVWVSGVLSPCDVNIWASLIRYCHSRKLENKQFCDEDGFLLMCYSRTEKLPSFFECTVVQNTSSYKLFQSHEELNLFQESSRKADTTFVYFPLSLTEISPIHQVVEIALRTVKNSTSDQSLLQFVDEFSSIVACSPPEEPSPCPQLVPSPHFSNHLKSVDSVPEISIWEPVIGPANNSGSAEQDHGFFSKSSSDHDSSTDRMYNFPSRQIISVPLQTIESSTNIGDKSSVRSPNESSHNGKMFHHSDSTRSVIAQSECHSCRSEKTEMAANLQQQKRQLEMLQKQIQALLEAQNINIPFSFNKNVSTRSAQTSPAESTINSIATELPAESRQNEVPKTMASNSQSIKSSECISVAEETLISIDPNSVAVQEDTQSHDNVVISHVEMPSFADSEMNETSIAIGNWNESNSHKMIELGDENSHFGSMELHVLNCLNSSQLRGLNKETPKKTHLEKLQAQIANALILNSNNVHSSEADEISREIPVLECTTTGMYKQPVINLEIPTAVTAQNVNIEYNYSDRMRSVDLSLEANAIAMRYGANFDVDDTCYGIPHYDRCERQSNFLKNSQQLRFNSTDVSFATERYLERHGIANSSPIAEESFSESSLKSYVNSLNTKKSRTSITNETEYRACQNSSSRVSKIFERNSMQEGRLAHPEKAIRRNNDDNAKRVISNLECRSDEEDNILDIDKLRALPKLL